MGDFFAKGLEPTVEQVASATTYWIIRLNDVVTRTRFYLIQQMLERFDLVKKKKE